MDLFSVVVGFLLCLVVVSFATNKIFQKSKDMMDEASKKLDAAHAAFDRASDFLDRADKRWTEVRSANLQTPPPPD